MMESLTGLLEFNVQHTWARGIISHYAGNKKYKDIEDQTSLI